MGKGENLGGEFPKTLLFSKGNSMPINFGNFANLIVRYLVVISEAPKRF